MGNGLSIVANEEYLTISSTLDPPHKATTDLAAPRPHPSGCSPRIPAPSPASAPHVAATPVSPPSLPPDTPASCSPAQPLTTQPPKTPHHLAHRGLHPGHHEVKLAAPPPQPITTQVAPSMPPCALTLPTPAHGHSRGRESVEKRDRHRQGGDDEEDVDEEEEESRRKASL